MLVEPWVFGTNTFDFAHFKSVHHFHMSDVNVVQKENQMYWEGTVEITDKGKEFKGLLRLEAVGTASVITYMKEEGKAPKRHIARSEEHTSELQALIRISYAGFCLKKK